jgi:glyoxalase family protein
MQNTILGLHHITAIAGDAKRNFDFYTKILGLRLVKKTVNFDDPHTYHFYYGDKLGTPGTILTFFPWEDITPGRRGTGMATEFGYSVPEGSLDFWLERFRENNIYYNKPAEKFGEKYLTFLDPDGLKIELVVSKNKDERTPWVTDEISASVATKGFHHVTLSLHKVDRTAEILKDVFGYSLLEQHVNRYRFKTDAVPNAALVDLVEVPGEKQGLNAGGTIHHIAFRVKDDASELFIRNKLIEKGLQATPVIDRNYFHSVYFREPGGVLFEIATDNPGFSVDEPVDSLGTALKLPSQYEGMRTEIESVLPALN